MNGIEYPNVSLTADLNFNAGTVVVAPNEPGGARYVAPMSFDGRMKIFAGAVGSGAPIFDATLVGTGFVRALFIDGLLGFPQGQFAIAAFGYSFDGTATAAAPAATPEPATLVLCSAGFLLVARRVRRKRP